MIGTFAAVVIPIAVANWLAIEAFWARAKQKGGCTVYAAPIGLKALYGVGVPVLIFGGAENYLQNRGEVWVSLLLFGGALFALYFYPPAILVCRTAITSIGVFGLKRKSIKWEDIEAIYAVPEERTIVIQDKSQSQIVHTIFNIDREGFARQLSAIAESASPKITLRL